jgi:hypothetical protein
MARITCRTPSTGKPLRLIYQDVPNTLVTLAEAPDFSVPDASNKFETRDPNDVGRAIRPGEIFFLTPLAAKNRDTVTRWIETVLVTEDNFTIELGKVEVPAGDTAFIPLQGRSIFKRNANNSIGDSIKIRAEISDVFDVWLAGEEKLSSEHTGVV